jgi:hypothetical protein
VEHIHKKIERLEAENRSLKHTNQGLVNMIEGLQNTNRRLLAVNAEYKGQAIRWSNQLDELVEMLPQNTQLDLWVEDGVVMYQGRPLGRVE